MTSFDSSRVISAFDGLVEHMQSIELPTLRLDTFHVSETVLPVFKTLLQQYADQHSRTKKDIASLRSAWTCISSVAPHTPPQAVLESSGSAMVPPASSLPDAAIDTVSDAASGNSELEHSRQLIEQLQKELHDLAAQCSAQNHFRTENEKLRLQISELEAQLNPPSSHSTFSKCSAAIVSGENRLRRQYLSDVFNRHKDASGCLSVATLAQALMDADAPVVPDSEADAAAAISRFDAYCNGLMDFGEFERAVNAPDELALFFQEKRMPALADALRALVGRGQDQLLKVSQLSPEQMQAAASAVCSHIPHQAKSIQEELQRSFTAQFELQAQAEGDGGNKFTISKMACGRIEYFHAGLSDRVGMPHLDFKREMMREHCERAGCDMEFTTSNYQITTTPKMEWLYVAGDESGQRVTCPAEFMHHGRTILALDELRQLDLAVRAKLNDEEILALVLYTGPMYQIYNVILRRYPEEKFKLFKEGGNTFATTIFVLVSAVMKVAKCTRIPEGTLLYRGLGGLMDLPDHFFNADENGASGFVDWGFMSTTSDRDVALGYSGVKQRRPKAMVMVIEVSSVDKGADISLFSQYRGEKEFLWVPCSFVQRAQQGGGRVEVVDAGLVTFLPVKVNLNLKTETLEELKEKKKRLHLVSARAMVEEVRYELGEWAKSAEAAARLQKDPYRNIGGTFTAATLAAAVVKQCEDVVKRHEAATLQEYVEDGTFRALVGEMLDAKAWTNEKKELWMRDASQYICFLQGWSLRECHRQWMTFQNRIIDRTSAGSSEKKSASLQLLVSRSLVKRGVVGEVNADGEDVMVQAGGDGWSAIEIHAAHAAGADVAAVDTSGYSGLWNAARYGHKESLAALLEVKGDVDKCSYDGRSPIYIVARNGHADCLKLLLDSGGDVNKFEKDGCSPIWTSAQKGHADCLKLLLTAGGDVNKCDMDDWSPIYVAASHGHTDCLKLLLDAGGDVNKCNNNGYSPIYIAAEKGHAECLKLLLAAGGDVNKCDKDGRSPIYIAASSGHSACISQLLASRADARSIFNGTSALDIARRNNHTDSLRVLEAALA
jgi:ankyrin repeat protein